MFIRYEENGKTYAIAVGNIFRNQERPLIKEVHYKGSLELQFYICLNLPEYVNYLSKGTPMSENPFRHCRLRLCETRKNMYELLRTAKNGEYIKICGVIQNIKAKAKDGTEYTFESIKCETIEFPDREAALLLQVKNQITGTTVSAIMQKHLTDFLDFTKSKNKKEQIEDDTFFD